MTKTEETEKIKTEDFYLNFFKESHRTFWEG